MVIAWTLYAMRDEYLVPNRKPKCLLARHEVAFKCFWYRNKNHVSAQHKVGGSSLCVPARSADASGCSGTYQGGQLDIVIEYTLSLFIEHEPSSVATPNEIR